VQNEKLLSSVFKFLAGPLYSMLMGLEYAISRVNMGRESV